MERNGGAREVEGRGRRIPLTSPDTSADPSSVSSLFAWACVHDRKSNFFFKDTEVHPQGKMRSAQSSVIVIAQQAMGHALPL